MANIFSQVNGYEQGGKEIQNTVGVVWWPTFIIYQDGKEVWRAQVTNQVHPQPTAKLEAALLQVLRP